MGSSTCEDLLLPERCIAIGRASSRRTSYRPIRLPDPGNKFRTFSVSGTELNKDKIDRYVNESLMLVTALSPVIGYQNSAHIAESALAKGQTLRQAAIESKHVDEETFDRVVDPTVMIGDGVAGA